MEIKSTKNIQATAMNVLIFGESGVGKTTLASTLQGKTVIVSMESGLLSLKKFDIDYIEVKSIENLRTTLSELSKSNYDNIYIDSLSEVSQMFFEQAKLKYPEDKQTMKLYGFLLETMTKFIKYCRDMNKNIYFTALQKTTPDETGRRYHTPDLQGSIAYKCTAFFDFVFNYQVVQQEGKDIRYLITNKIENTISKDRSGVLDPFEKPNLGAIVSKIFNQGEKNV